MNKERKVTGCNRVADCGSVKTSGKPAAILEGADRRRLYAAVVSDTNQQLVDYYTHTHDSPV